MTNVYLEKVAGHYQDLNNFRKNIHRESNEIYHDSWEGHIPSRITTKAMEDFRDETYVDDDGEVITPDLNQLVRDRMKERYVNAGLEEAYGNNVVREADHLAHNNAALKGFGAMLLGGIGSYGLAARVTRHPLVSAGAGIAGAGLGAFFVGKHALNKGEAKADEYLGNIRNKYLQKSAELGRKTKRKYGAGGAFVGSASLIGSGAVHDYKSLTKEKRLGKFQSSAYPIVKRVREKAYAEGADQKAEAVRKSVSHKYNKTKHLLSRLVDRHAGKSTRRYVASSVLTGLGVGLLHLNRLENNKKD